jgi:hypothetical protein
MLIRYGFNHSQYFHVYYSSDERERGGGLHFWLQNWVVSREVTSPVTKLKVHLKVTFQVTKHIFHGREVTLLVTKLGRIP